jgi:hypothetical protein
MWNDMNAFLPKYIADRLTAGEKGRLASSISDVLNGDTPYPKVGAAYSKILGMGDFQGKNVHEKVVGNWFGSMDALVDALINTMWETYSPTGAGSPTKTEQLAKAASDEMANMPIDEMQAALSRKIRSSGVLGELPFREVPWMSSEAYESTVSVVGNAYTKKGGIETLDPKFISEAKGWFTSGKVWESPELRRRILELTPEQQAQVKVNVGFANQGQFDLLVSGGRIDTALSRFRVTSISPEGDVYGFNNLPVYGAKELWGGPDGRLYVGDLDDIVNTARRSMDPKIDGAQFSKIIVRHGAAEDGKRTISMMLEKSSQVRSAQNMVEFRRVEALQQGLENMMVDVASRTQPGQKKSTVNTVASTLLGVEGRFVDVAVGSGRFAGPELVERNFNAQVLRAIESVQVELNREGRSVNIGDRQRVWNLAHGYIEQMEPSSIKNGVFRQFNNRYTALKRIQELIAWASGV